MSNDWYQDIVDLQTQVFERKVPIVPIFPNKSNQKLQKKLVKEEIKEVMQAHQQRDLVEVADGIADSIVVLLGMAVNYGIDLRPIWDEVHKTNMAKLGGPVREDGKRLKPDGWQPPDVRSILLDQGMADD